MKWLPMKPAPPTIRYLFASFFKNDPMLYSQECSSIDRVVAAYAKRLTRIRRIVHQALVSGRMVLCPIRSRYGMLITLTL